MDLQTVQRYVGWLGPRRRRGSDAAKVLSDAAKGILSVEGIGFDPKEIEEVFGKSDSTTA